MGPDSVFKCNWLQRRALAAHLAPLAKELIEKARPTQEEFAESEDFDPFTANTMGWGLQGLIDFVAWAEHEGMAVEIDASVPPYKREKPG